MSDDRSPAQIEADLARTREDLTATLNELVDQVDPRKAAQRGKESAQAAVADLSERAKDTAAELQAKGKQTIEDAKAGDTRARGLIAGAGVGLALVGALILHRLVR